jgi:alkylation response protein AidB-like acyl-CoA dehydrogenase
MDIAAIIENVQAVSTQFAQERRQRQVRRALVRADFDHLKAAGLHLTGTLVEQGGLWESMERSTRPICELLRILAHGDSSVALVSSMHPSVLALWLATSEVEPPSQAAWEEQRNACSQSAFAGHWWGTITSEPGSGGDISQTKATARLDASAEGDPTDYRITGQKHFGSGSGITSFMVTTAVPVGEQDPDLFFFDMRDVPWDGSVGATLIAPWEGHGMIATQSHAMAFDDFPATRCAWPGNVAKLAAPVFLVSTCCFTAVIVGIVETALDTAHQSLDKRRASLRAYEQVEFERAEVEGWLIQQAYEGMLRAVEQKGVVARRDALLAKTAVAELAESCMGRLCKVMGGGTYARRSPFGFWFEDVRALGFLRPPWALAYDQLFQGSWPTT